MDAPTRNDTLASNLLFALLALAVGERLYLLLLAHSWHQNLLTRWFYWLLPTLGQAILYGDIRAGKKWAKATFVVLCGLTLYAGTDWPQGYVAGIAFRHVDGWAAVGLLRGLLALAALVLMFTKPRTVAPSGT